MILRLALVQNTDRFDPVVAFGVDIDQMLTDFISAGCIAISLYYRLEAFCLIPLQLNMKS